MQPNNTFIAPGSYQQKTGPSKKMIFIVAGLVVAILFSAILMLFGSSGESTGELATRLNVRLGATQSLIEDGIANVGDSDLRATVQEVRLVLESDMPGLASYGNSKPDKTLVAEEAVDSTIEDLAKAKLQGSYDTKFRAALSQQLESSNALASEIYEKSNDSELRSILNTLYDHLSEMQNRLAD